MSMCLNFWWFTELHINVTAAWLNIRGSKISFLWTLNNKVIINIQLLFIENIIKIKLLSAIDVTNSIIRLLCDIEHAFINIRL